MILPMWARYVYSVRYNYYTMNCMQFEHCQSRIGVRYLYYRHDSDDDNDVYILLLSQ